MICYNYLSLIFIRITAQTERTAYLDKKRLQKRMSLLQFIIAKFFIVVQCAITMILYLETDVTLFAGVYASFREYFKDTFDLDPCHFYSAPNITWDAMFNFFFFFGLI